MAVATRTVLHIEGSATVQIVYDDTNETPESIDACDLIRVDVTVVNPVEVLIQRGNRATWQSRILTGSASFNAGGPVRQVDDLARFSLRTT